MSFTIHREEDRIDWENLDNGWLAPLVRTHVEIKIKAVLEYGLPSDWRERCQEFGEVLCEKADILLYPDKKNIQQAENIFENLTDAIAILAFVPGGVRIFGYHYKASFNGCSET